MTQPNPTPNIPPERAARQIDPDLLAAARRSDMPDGSLYDTSAIDGGGPSNWYALAAVLIAISAVLLVFYIFV